MRYHNILTTVSTAFVLLVGCGSPARQQVDPPPVDADAVNRAAGAARSVPADLSAGQGGAVMARVKGEPVYMDKLNDLLLANYGLPVAQQLIANKLVDIAAREQGVVVTEQDVRDEHRQTVERMFDGVDATVADRENMFVQMLERQGVTRQQWDMTMRRNARLGKIAAKSVDVGDEELREAFGQVYGRKRIVRHIQLTSLEDAQAIKKKLDEGADFGEMVARHSTNPETRAQGGALPPISTAAEDGVSPPIRQMAMAMDQAGQISDPVQAGTAFHLLKLERIVEPEDVKFEDVADELREQVYQSKLAAGKQQILMNLIRQAEVDGEIQYVNPILKAQADQAARSLRNRTN